MANARAEPPGSSTADAAPMRLVLGIAIPLALVGVASGLGWISDQIVYVGPLDRAAFGWAVVAPIWLSSPVAAGFIWRSLTRRQAGLAAVVVGAVVSAAAALLFWQWIGTPFDCGFGTVTPAIDFLPQTLIVGALVGGGLALSGLFVTELARAGVRWWAVVIGAGSELVLLFLAVFIAFAAAGGHICYVPGPNYPVQP